MHAFRTRTDSVDDDGFTLIELLVVVLIIGILAALAIPQLLGQRQRATETAMKADLRTVAGKMETYYVDTLTYPVDMTPFAGDFVPGQGNTVTIETVGALPGTYCLKVTNPAASGDLYYDSDRGGLLLPVGTVCS
jgi:prepilin-type N-terminal cleavage/methylation domain-containing protein